MGYNNGLILSSTMFPILMIVTWSLLIPIAFPIIQDVELDYKCLPSDKTITNNYYQSRALITKDLITNTPSHNGFMSGSYTWPDPTETSYGLALCRGDVSDQECQACLKKATTALIYTYCRDARSAIILRDFCLLKYSDVDFFKKINTDYWFILKNEKSWPKGTFNDSAMNLLGNVSQTAVKSPKFYANQNVSLKVDNYYDFKNINVYGAAQCTGDLNEDDCKTCLEYARRDLSSCCINQMGARVVYESCNLRYEVYEFFNR